MLLIKTKLTASSIHGFGVVADEHIKKGAEVWRFQPGFDLEKTKEEVAALPEHAREWLKQFAYLDHHIDQYILSFDNARFINHSEVPNIRPDYGKERHGVGIAQSDITPGDELTINYREIEYVTWLGS